jgi:tetratricopeptide (TPR) repeat protein
MKFRPARAWLVCLVSIALAAGCASQQPAPSLLTSTSVGEVPYFDGLGPARRDIGSKSPEAQRYFDQGLAFLFAFNHDEAMRSFRKAAEYDPAAAMPWWGVAYAQGPHINFPMMTPPQAATAWDALQRARKNIGQANATDAALIEALSKRYVKNPPADRKALDEAYATAMREVWKRYPNDADVGAFYAESLMDLRPWNQWTREGQPNPGTLEVLETLDAVIKLNAFHPLANHLYIHATEASLQPERADGAADRLRDLQPGLGHNVHMPSHTDVRRGRWRESMEANQKAIRADERYRAKSPQQEFYGLYMAHNHHMLAFSAMMVGQKKESLRAIDTITAAIPPDWAEKWAPIADGFLAMPLEVRVRFGMWDEVLAAPEPAATFPFARTMRHYARGVAYSAKGDTKSARAEQAAFTQARSAVAADCLFGNNKCSDLLGVADRVLDGEISYREGKSDAAFTSLQEAVVLEDKLNYDEPPSWILPARHTLGAAYLDANKPKEAERVFRLDLEKLPHNGWGLYGLASSLRAQKRSTEAAKVDAEFRKAWAGSDFKITSPCACLAAP